jgi:subtilase family serine protease
VALLAGLTLVVGVHERWKLEFRMGHRQIVSVLALTGALALVLGMSAHAGANPSGSGITHRNVRVCPGPTAGHADCLAIRHDRVDSTNQPVPNAATPSGYGPADIRSAYNLSTSSSATVAIVDAYDDPTAAADLATYRSRYGLPSCTTANGCFRKVNQTGGTVYPRKDGGWAQEISLDLDMVSAACPTCHILLVEAKTSSFANLGAGVNYAAKVNGVVAISNSYGGGDSAETAAYNHPGIAVTASTGDSGYGVQSPASFPHVIAVGGTALTKATSTSRGWSESAWSGAGSGCSTINPKPTWQTAVTQCNGKASADVSAVADPNTGVAVYDSTSYQGHAGWMVFGGTSASSPIVASVYALSGNTAGYPALHTWANPGGLNDVTIGANGTCATAIWCHAAPGWDGPTGLGTPNGTNAF